MISFHLIKIPTTTVSHKTISRTPSLIELSTATKEDDIRPKVWEISTRQFTFLHKCTRCFQGGLLVYQVPHNALRPGHSMRMNAPVYHLESPRTLWRKVICSNCHVTNTWILRRMAPKGSEHYAQKCTSTTPQNPRDRRMTNKPYHLPS